MGLAALHIFSDGCSSQYKSQYTFHHLSQLQELHPHIKITRHFLGSNHGKSLCDSCGEVVKNAATSAVLAGREVIQSAQQMFDYCSKNLTVTGDDSCSHLENLRSFAVIQPTDIPSKYFPAKGMLSIKNLSCFCEVCLLGEEGVCENKNFTGGWEMCKLVYDKQSKKGRKLKNISQADLGQSEDDVASADALDACETPVVSVSRQDFFDDFQSKLQACNSFDELRRISKLHASKLDAYPLPAITPKRVMDIGIVDKIAMALLPDYCKPLLPVLTVADGNCVPRTLSLLSFGDQEHHVELCCRIVMELTLNSLDYLCLPPEDLHFLHILSDCYCSSVQDTLKSETLSIAKNSVYMGIWQIVAASNVLSCNILSVFPEKGASRYRLFFTRKITPRGEAVEPTVALMWSAIKEHSLRMLEETGLPIMLCHSWD